MTSASSTKGNPNPNIWKKILLQNSRFMAQRHATVLMFGRTGIGKRRLLQALEHVNSSSWRADHEFERTEPVSAQALNYAYLQVHNSRAIQTTDADTKKDPLSTSFWILEDIKHKGVLFSRLTEAKLKDAAVVICLDMQEPWHALPDLEQWLEVVKEIFMQQIEHLPEETKVEYMQRVLDPLPEESRSNIINFGIPIVVVATRCDAVASWSDSREYYGWAETVECYLRKECLEYGASLIYTMAPAPKQTKNVGPLYHYFGHLLGGFPFTPPSPSTPDSVFVVPGTDTMEKILASSSDVTSGMTKQFNEVVCDPSKGQSDKGDVLEAENINQFLQKAQALMKKDGNVRSFSRTAKGVPREDDKVLTKFFEKLLARDEPSASKKSTGGSRARPQSQKTTNSNSITEPSRESRRVRAQASRVSMTDGARSQGETRKSTRLTTVMPSDDMQSPSGEIGERNRRAQLAPGGRCTETDALETSTSPGQRSRVSAENSPQIESTESAKRTPKSDNADASAPIVSMSSSKSVGAPDARKRQSVIFNMQHLESEKST